MYKILILLFLVIARINYCQDGKLVLPKIEFDDKLINEYNGDFFLEFKINNQGKIISSYLSTLYLISKVNGSDTEYNREVIFSSKFVKRNTKLGIELFNKIKPWVKIFCSKVSFSVLNKEELSKLPKDGYVVVYNHNIRFGKIWLRKDFHFK